jgi:hypothetical protein
MMLQEGRISGSVAWRSARNELGSETTLTAASLPSNAIAASLRAETNRTPSPALSSSASTLAALAPSSTISVFSAIPSLSPNTQLIRGNGVRCTASEVRSPVIQI